MNYIGIILAKSHSERLPNKNFLMLDGWEVWRYAFNALENAGYEVEIFGQSFNNRPPAASLDNEPLFSALKWAYKTLPKRYDAIICIMANCPQHTAEGVKAAVKRFEELGCDELRSFSKNGRESGLIIVKEKYLLEKHEISTYQGAITLDSMEIHDQADFDQLKQQHEN